MTLQRRFAESEQFLIESYRQLRESRGITDQSTQQAALGLIELYQAWGKPERAAEVRMEMEGKDE